MIVEKSNNIIIYIFVITILICSLFSVNIVLDYYLMPRIFLLSFCTPLILVFLLVKSKKIRFAIDFFSVLYLFFILYSIISITWSINYSISVVEVSKNILFYTLFLLSLIFLLNFKNRFLTLLLKTILLIFFISTFKIFFEIASLEEISRESLYGLRTISGHKNLYSSFIYLVSIFSFYAFFSLKKYWKLIALIAILVQLVLVSVIQTRAVWIGYFVFFVSMLIMYFKNWKQQTISFKLSKIYIATIIILINIFFLFIFPRVTNEFIQNIDVLSYPETIFDLSTLSERFLIWNKTYDVIFDNLLFGVGPNNWKLDVSSYSLPNIYRIQDLNFIFQRPHNDFLWILSEYGLIGFNIMLLLIISILFYLYSVIKLNFRIEDIILFSGFIGFFVISFFSFPKERVEHNILFAVLLSIAVYTIKNSNLNISEKKIRIPKFLFFTLIPTYIFIIYINLLQIKGEYFTKKIYVAKNKGDNKAVISSCVNALSLFYKLDPTSIPINWYKGNANSNLGNISEAMTSFKIAQKQHPNNIYVLNDLGSIHFIENNIDSAMFFYKRAVKINPRFDEPKLNLVVVYLIKGDYLEAKKWNESLFHDSNRRTKYRDIINQNINK